jgi:DNA mismatch endonuclease (patch repair protein)
MPDKLTPEQRHKCMASIKSRNTRPEVLVRKFLFAHGYRFRINVKRLPGTPDIVLKKYRTCIFVNGCFWHGHEGCKYYVMPKTNTEFWKAKIERNRARDLDRRIKLRDMGWHVIQIWECQLKPKVREEYLEGLLLTLNRILIMNYQPMIYKTEEESVGMVAEPE